MTPTTHDVALRLPPEGMIQLAPDEWTAPFWEAAAQHRLVVPRCTTCGAFRFPPSPFCWRCRAQAIDWVERPGQGVVYSYTVVWHPILPDLADSGRRLGCQGSISPSLKVRSMTQYRSLIGFCPRGQRKS